jgi:hypothetical protein
MGRERRCQHAHRRAAGDAKITIDQARAIALKAHPGRITDEELEHEGGGSGLPNWAAQSLFRGFLRGLRHFA